MNKFTTILYGISSFAFILLATVMTIDACKISEFACRGGTFCLPLDKYCDGKDDCGDASDEPKFCTVCNRTYYGDIGRTYSLRVPPPQWNRLPFLCHITFTASGHEQGDIVQIIFDGFSVGRFDEGLIDSESDSSDLSLSAFGDLPGCPEGFMQLSELGRPFTGGSWCGAATGPQLYYSETSTVTASVKVFHAPMQAATPFEFRIRYKFISQSDAIVRYGTPNELLELGRVTPGTYCTRQFDECYRKKCRLQSPNYPGMYPRNVTCYWTIREKTVPTCKHAMISVSQENSHKALVKRSIASLNKTFRSIRAWSDCTGERDHLIFYDGSSTNDPVLAKYCGGDWLPRVISRGPEMLVAFHSSPFSAPLQSNIPNRGFELDVDVLFADSDSYDFARVGNKGSCEFHINASNPDDVLLSRRGRMGKILSPRHTLPPNTTCTYYFHGQPGDLIWFAFTSYNLQILQHAIHDNNTLGRNDLPPWITRMRIWDSAGSYVNPGRTGTTTPTSITTSNRNNNNYNNNNNNNNGSVTTSNYYYSPQNPLHGKHIKVNIDNVWNPVDSYIYGPTQNTIFNQQENKYGGLSPQKFDKFGNSLSSAKDATLNYGKTEKIGYGTTSADMTVGRSSSGGGGGGGGGSGSNSGGSSVSSATTTKSQKYSSSRKLIAELYDNETPRLCDHSLLEEDGNRMRPCSPLESYVSASKDLKIEFHTHTGTALYPASFSLNYEFVDTDLGGDNWTGRRGEDPVPLLCSRIFRKRRGNVQSPRNVFLHGRGGAKNITCLYRFEAGVGERVKMLLHNVSFGDTATCNTEPDIHTGRPQCTPLDTDIEGRHGELKLFDVPHRDVKISLGCFCDNTSSLYNTPLTVQSYSKTMELLFTVTKLNISEDFADIYFYASYEYVKVPECRKKMRLKGAGGEEYASYPIRPAMEDVSCDGMPWYAETQHPDRSLFILTWGSFLPNELALDDSLRCNTKNRLLIYSGKPLKLMRIICPTVPGPRPTALHIFSENWLNAQPQTFGRTSHMVLEPVLKEPGNIAFQWLEIQPTRASLLQQLDPHSNFSLNDTLNEFGFTSRRSECEYICPDLNACIDSSLYCDGRLNCPSGYDESEEECGTARKLLELPGGLFAALGCIAAAITACLIFCIFGLVRKKRKTITTKQTNGLNGTLKSGDYKKDSLFMDTGS